MYIRDYSTLYLDTNSTKGTACSKQEYGLLQAIPLLEFVS
jgi:hypothetical protein